MGKEDIRPDWQGAPEPPGPARSLRWIRLKKTVSRAWRWMLFLVALMAFGLWAATAGRPGDQITEIRQGAKDQKLRMLTRLEMQSAVSVLEAAYLSEGALPTDWKQVLAENLRYENEGSRPWQDFWGRDYVLEPVTNGFALRSLGPDGQSYNQDDLVLMRPFED